MNFKSYNYGLHQQTLTCAVLFKSFQYYKRTNETNEIYNVFLCYYHTQQYAGRAAILRAFALQTLLDLHLFTIYFIRGHYIFK